MKITIDYNEKFSEYLQVNYPWRKWISNDPQMLQVYLTGINKIGNPIVSPFEMSTTNQLFLKNIIYSYYRSNSNAELKNGFNRESINNVKYFFYLHHGEIEYVLFDPFDYYRKCSCNSIFISLIQEYSFMKLLFDVCNEVDDNLINNVVDYIFCISRFFGFYPYTILKQNTDTPYSKPLMEHIDIENFCSKFCLETSEPIETGLFKNANSYSGFTCFRSIKEPFYRHVCQFNDEISQLISFEYESKNDLDFDNEITVNINYNQQEEQNSVSSNFYSRLDKKISLCKEQIVKKINIGIKKKISNHKHKGHSPDITKVNHVLNNLEFKSTAANTKMKVLDLLMFMPKYTIEDLEKIEKNSPIKNFDILSYKDLVDASFHMKEIFVTHTSKNLILNDNEELGPLLFEIHFARINQEFKLIKKNIDLQALYLILRIFQKNSLGKRGTRVQRLINRNAVALLKNHIDDSLIRRRKQILLQYSSL